MTAGQKALFEARVGMAMIERDFANTRWLKGVVAADGWPRRTMVGEAVAHSAWLLVQHADHDPSFQLRALRLMEPLLKTGEVDRADYAYLHDRIMLKIGGKQRYGTQVECRAGRYVPKPLEDEAAMETWRRDVGLNSFDEYGEQMMRGMGACRADTAPH